MRVRNGEVTLATESFGDPDNPALVLVMGATASMIWWPDDLCGGLAALGLHVIRFDHRDTGASTLVPLGEARYSVEDMAGDVLAIMDAYGIGAAHLMGMSLGGYIAQMVALMQPGRVRSLVLYAAEPLGGVGRDLPGLDDRFMAHFERFGEVDWSDDESAAPYLVESLRLCAGRPDTFDPESAMAHVRRDLARTADISSSFNHGSVTTREDWTGRVRDIAQPVLVIHGSDDPILPLPNGEAIAEAVPGAELMVLDGIGHALVPSTFPDLLDRIGGFVKSA